MTKVSVCCYLVESRSLPLPPHQTGSTFPGGGLSQAVTRSATRRQGTANLYHQSLQIHLRERWSILRALEPCPNLAKLDGSP